jgi:hypothetical protein
MRREWRLGLAIVIAFAVGTTCAEGYARLAAHYYATIAEWIAETHPWKIISVAVARDESNHSAVLLLTGDVRRERTDSRPAVRIVSRIQVGEVIETPLVFWTILALWPAKSMRRRLGFLAVGAPVFLLLEAATTAMQLVNPMAEASAILGGDLDPLTLWERWSRFLEAGGRFVVETAGALLAVAIVEFLPSQIK